MRRAIEIGGIESRCSCPRGRFALTATSMRSRSSGTDFVHWCKRARRCQELVRRQREAESTRQRRREAGAAIRVRL
jgi:hypothetical protein